MSKCKRNFSFYFLSLFLNNSVSQLNAIYSNKKNHYMTISRMAGRNHRTVTEFQNKRDLIDLVKTIILQVIPRD